MTDRLADDNRYGHLLQPIRDLATNWNINIADDLEDYLEELEKITFAFEDGPSLNFAEAALLIQGSTAVYGRKVEYLLSLVHKTIEFLSNKKKESSKRQRNRDGQHEELDCDEDGFFAYDQLIDDVRDIDLVADGAPCTLRSSKRPALLLAFESYGGSKGDGDSGVYMVQRCAVHASGALLLEPGDGDAYGHLLQPLGPTQHAAAAGVVPDVVIPPEARGNGLPPGDEEMATVGDDALQQHEGNGAGAGALGGGVSDDDMLHDYGDDDGGGSFAPSPSEGGDGGEAGVVAHHADGAAVPAVAGELGDQDEEEEEEEEDVFDPYAPLDPHAPGDAPARPLRKRLPRPRLQPQARFTGELQLPLTAPAAPTSAALAFPEFAPYDHRLRQLLRQADTAAAAAAKARGAAALRSARAAAVAPAWAFEAAAAVGQADEEEEEDPGAYGNDSFAEADSFGAAGGGDSDDDGGDAGGFGDDAGGGWWGGGDDVVYGGGGGTVAPGEGSSYEELCRAHIEAFINAAAAAQVESALSTRVSSWQAKIQPVLDEQATLPEFDIHCYGKRLLTRLADLSLSTGPGSSADAAAPAAADSSCARRAGVAGTRQPVDLGEVLGCCEHPYEVSRMFSSMLQLINNGNVAIDKPPPPALDPAKAGGTGGSDGRACGRGVTLRLEQMRLAHERFDAEQLLPQGGGDGEAAGAGCAAERGGVAKKARKAKARA